MDEAMNVENPSEDHAVPTTLSQAGCWIAFLVFLIVGLFLAMPVLCRQGAVAGLYKSVFYLVVVCRLSYGLLRRNIDTASFLLWTGGFVLFCIIADNLY